MPNQKTKDYLKYFPRGKKSTRSGNATRFKKFCLWLGKTPEQLKAEYEKAKESNDLDTWERETTNEILQFYNWIQKQKSPRTKEFYSINYANTVISSILAFHHQNTRAIEGVFDYLKPIQIPTDEYRFSQDDLRKMFYYGDTEEKALLSLAVSLGQGSKDFLGLKAQRLRDIVDEAKEKGLDFAKFIGEPRAKTSIQPRCFLTPEALESVDEYLKLLEKKYGKLPTYIWSNSKPDKPITNEGLNKKLRRLVKKANINTHDKPVHFHLIRKFTFSRLRRIDKDMAKIIVAKSVSVSDMTYEEIDEQCEKTFRLAYKHISLNGDVSGETKRKQTETIKQLESQLEAMRTVMFGLLGLNREQVEKLVAKHLDMAMHEGMTPIEYVKSLSLEQLADEFRIILKTQKQDHSS